MLNHLLKSQPLWFAGYMMLGMIWLLALPIALLLAFACFSGMLGLAIVVGLYWRQRIRERKKQV
ncbi:MAG TPA: hypothetical protein VK846_08915 [Candidatus Limnocylindria bacterium]|nr:hypothetical protein [Candidatus Limnocylindria bacterium]